MHGLTFLQEGLLLVNWSPWLGKMHCLNVSIPNTGIVMCTCNPTQGLRQEDG